MMTSWWSIRAGYLDESERLDVLPKSQRLFIDIFCTIAYRVETRMLAGRRRGAGQKAQCEKSSTGPVQCRCQHLPDHGQGILKVQILGLGSN